MFTRVCNWSNLGHMTKNNSCCDVPLAPPLTPPLAPPTPPSSGIRRLGRAETWPAPLPVSRRDSS